jgi:NADPH:quinone reductase-like Zn-dependent oxidoreductase
MRKRRARNKAEMKAILFTEYGPPERLRLGDVEVPRPGRGEILIRVRATTVTRAECMMRRGDTAMARLVLGLRKPRRRYRVMGSELAGEVAEAGEGALRFKAGDRVYGFTGFRQGAHAEYACVAEKASIASIPAKVGYEEAASLADGATTASFFLRGKARLRAGQRVLVIGASGSIGAAAVQIAAALGAEVSGVCSGRNVELVRSLGAARVFDYEKEEFTEAGEAWDLIFDTLGVSSFAACKASLAPRGIYMRTTGGLPDFARTVWTAVLGGKREIYAMSIDKRKDLAYLNDLLSRGGIKSVIDRRYALSEIADAFAYVETGRKRGNVVVTP